jgi:hypothetical protein
MTTSCIQHEWVVFSTALADGWLMLQCIECGKHGTVEDPTKEEWSDAFSAPSRPYRWRDDTRVTIKDGDASCHVMRRGTQRCQCYDRRGILEPGDYERVPAEITRPNLPLTTQDRMELQQLAEWVGGTDLCSFLFPVFVRSFQAHTGIQHSSAVNAVARRIVTLDRKGLHCSPSVVARVLRDYGK